MYISLMSGSNTHCKTTAMPNSLWCELGKILMVKIAHSNQRQLKLDVDSSFTELSIEIEPASSSWNHT